MNGMAPGEGRSSYSLPVLHGNSPGLQALKGFPTTGSGLDNLMAHGKGQPCLLAYGHCRWSQCCALDVEVYDTIGLRP